VSDWIEQRLGEVCSRLSSGSNITAKDIHESGSFPVFGGNGIRGYAEEANFSGECAIIGRQGAYCGNVRYFIGKARMSEHAVLACAGPSHNTRFLAYLLSNMNLGSLSGQAAQPGLSVKVLAQQSVRMPSRQHQERIAEILGNYDDLIEVNRRRIAVLEEMARGLFEEWFIRLGFSGHEQTPKLDGPPTDWQLTKVGTVLQKFRRPAKVQKQNYEQDGTIPCVDQGAEFIGGYTNNVDALITAPLPLCVFGDHTRILKYITFPFASGADGTQLLYPVNGITTEFLYWSLLNVDLSNQHYARHFKFLKEQEIWIPPTELIERFTLIVKPEMEMIANIKFQNQNLAASRDLLLPRLISGQLSVAEAERELEAAA
jgi:type I restriction enzyme S subunit